MELKHLPVNTPIDAILAAVGSDAGVVIEGVLPIATLEEVTRELRPHIERTAAGNDDFSGTSTTRTGGLLARSQAVRTIVQHPMAVAVATSFLAQWCDRIQLQLTQVIRLLPGQGAQPLHRDRLIWGDVFGNRIAGVEPQLNCMWAITDFTSENGATNIVPGSHAWDRERKAAPHEIAQASMPRGSVLFYTGSVLHGGGCNRSSSERIGLNINYCLSWLRQEENQYLSCPPEVARGLDPNLQELVGYTTGGFGLGYYTSLEEPGVQAPEAALGRKPREQLHYAGPAQAPL